MSTSDFKLTFDAVYYHVANIEKSIAFYRDILGFHLTSRDYVARFDLGGVLFELVPNPPGNALPGTGNARVSLGVTDIRQATRELNARGVATTLHQDHVERRSRKRSVLKRVTERHGDQRATFP